MFLFQAAGAARCPAGAPLVSRVAEARPDPMFLFRAAGAARCPASVPPVSRRCPVGAPMMMLMMIMMMM
eukprot:8708593-Pyramimonas_sp.AAC.1